MSAPPDSRLLPSVPEWYRFPLQVVHGHQVVKRAGGLPLIVEGVIEMLPKSIVRLDRPENIPPPVKRLLRAVYREKPFGLVIVTEGHCDWIDVHG